jgi:phage terminase large subunit
MLPSADIKIIPKLVPVFAGSARYRAAFGGRGSGKSFTFAKMCALRGYEKPMTILCCREIQNSIKDSVLAEIEASIRSEPFLDWFYDVGETYIQGRNGTRFIFKGLYRNLDTLKSISGVDICWIEEAETVAEKSWQKLTPTIRKPGSEIWLTWNRESSDSATNERFIKNPPENMNIAMVNYSDNPWFPAELEQERLNDLKRDPDLYEHIWNGDYITRSEAQIFKDKYRIDEFEPAHDWSIFHGMDFGFANDPSCLVRCYVHNNTLFISHDSGAVGLELDDTAEFFKKTVPGCEQFKIRADNARPESISYLKRHGLPFIEACTKGKGSVEDGIQHMKSYDEIVIHPRCDAMIKEARLYSFKVDKLSGDVLPIIIDAHNHRMDATRYALEPVMKNAAVNYQDLL